VQEQLKRFCTVVWEHSIETLRASDRVSHVHWDALFQSQRKAPAASGTLVLPGKQQAKKKAWQEL